MIKKAIPCILLIFLSFSTAFAGTREVDRELVEAAGGRGARCALVIGVEYVGNNLLYFFPDPSDEILRLSNAFSNGEFKAVQFPSILLIMFVESQQFFHRGLSMDPFAIESVRCFESRRNSTDRLVRTRPWRDSAPPIERPRFLHSLQKGL